MRWMWGWWKGCALLECLAETLLLTSVDARFELVGNLSVRLVSARARLDGKLNLFKSAEEKAMKSVTITFVGYRSDDVAKKFYTWVVDGGLQDSIIDNLSDNEVNV